MKTESRHTTTPWRIIRDDKLQHAWQDHPPIIVADGGIFGDIPIVTMPRDQDRDANAEFIITAVNQHDKLLGENARLREALKGIYDETVDYIRLNHLGDTHHNYSMQQARAALAETEKD